MPDSLVFLDTNILVYAYSANEPDKALIAKKLLATGAAVVSAQVLNEFVSVMHRKLNLPVDVITTNGHPLYRLTKTLFCSIIYPIPLQ